MRLSGLLGRTLRDAPGDAEAASHKLLVRAAYTRRLASGVWSFLPLGRRVLRNVELVVREEMDAIGGQEVLLPVLTPRELFERSGRIESMADILFQTEGFVLGPTHEEVITALVLNETAALPLIAYQVQTKFRNEPRPRYGLLRTRELVMKDAYSFDADAESMQATYRRVYDAYARIFERCGIEATPVEASSGAIGGDVNHEWMVASEIGEDRVARCTGGCGYVANTEVAEAGPPIGADRHVPPEDLVEHHTPDRPGIDLVVEFFAERGLTAAGMLKCIALKDCQGNPVVALVPGHREVRLEPGMEPFTDDDFAAHPYLHKGYIGPMGLQEHGVRVVADHSVRRPGSWVTGANRPDHHVTGATLRRDFTVDHWGSIATVADGDPCPRCGRALELFRAVEAGHTFQLGHTYTDRFFMGCYGIGISRLVAVIAEAHHDDAGLAWPAGIAPYETHLIALKGAEEEAERLYDPATMLFDDRPGLSPGVKFADADLIGCPTQLVVGPKGVSRGVVEVKDRRTGERSDRPLPPLSS